MEPAKKLENERPDARLYFWRTYDQQGNDLAVESEGGIRGYEMKWDGRKGKIPKLRRDTYGPAEIVTPDRLLEFV
jgi:hypothetical protein